MHQDHERPEDLLHFQFNAYQFDKTYLKFEIVNLWIKSSTRMDIVWQVAGFCWHDGNKEHLKHMEAPGDKRVDDAELRYLLVGPTSDMLEKGPMTDSEMFG